MTLTGRVPPIKVASMVDGLNYFIRQWVRSSLRQLRSHAQFIQQRSVRSVRSLRYPRLVPILSTGWQLRVFFFQFRAWKCKPMFMLCLLRSKVISFFIKVVY